MRAPGQIQLWDEDVPVDIGGYGGYLGMMAKEKRSYYLGFRVGGLNRHTAKHACHLLQYMPFLT